MLRYEAWALIMVIGGFTGIILYEGLVNSFESNTRSDYAISAVVLLVGVWAITVVDRLLSQLNLL